MRILLADDHAPQRQVIRHALAEVLPNLMFGEAATCQQAKDLVTAVRWDLVVLDLDLPGGGAIALLGELQEIAPKVPMVILADTDDPDVAFSVFRAGAAGFLPKASTPDEVVEAVQRALAGHKYLSRQLAEKLADRLVSEPGVRRRDTLSPRELEVLRLRAAGKTAEEIGQDLHLTASEIGRLNVRATAALVRFAIRDDAE